MSRPRRSTRAEIAAARAAAEEEARIAEEEAQAAAEAAAAEQKIQDRIQQWRGRKVMSSLFADRFMLSACGVEDQVEQLVTACGWPGALDLHFVTDWDDTTEFLGTLEYTAPREYSMITYRHRGVEYSCSMQELQQVFGWQPTEEGIYTPPLDNYVVPWNAIATGPYQGGESKGRATREPVLFFMHHFLSKTIFARKNADKIGRDELEVLYLLHMRRPVHWGHYFCQHLTTMRKTSHVLSGGMITYFLWTRHESPRLEEHKYITSFLLDVDWWKHGKNIGRGYPPLLHRWTYFLDPTLRQPSPPLNRGGRPRGQGHGVVIHDHEQQPPPQHQQPPPQQQFPQYVAPGGHMSQLMIDFAFNITRATILGYEQPSVSAPAGWRPGDPIPPAYL